MLSVLLPKQSRLSRFMQMGSLLLCDGSPKTAIADTEPGGSRMRIIWAVPHHGKTPKASGESA